MLKKILKLFRTKKTKEPIKLSETELEEWVEQQISQLNYNNFLKYYFQQIDEIKSKIETGLETLNQEKVHKDHKNVEERVKNIVKGHRDNYILQITIFLKQIKSGDTTETSDKEFKTLNDYFTTQKYNQKLNQELAQLAQKTHKSYQAAQHLYFDKVEKVFKLIAELNSLAQQFDKKISTKKLTELKAIKELIISIYLTKETKSELETEIKTKKEEIKKTESQLKNQKQELEKLKQSPEYTNHQKQLVKKTEIQEQIKNMERQVFDYFSKLSKVLRKYSKISTEQEIVDKYVENYNLAFQEDENLQIIGALNTLKNTLENNGLKFADKQRNNFIAQIEKQKLLTPLKQEITTLQTKLKETQTQLDQNEITAKITNQQIEISKSTEHLEKENNKLELLNHQQEKNNLENTKTKIKNKIKETFDENVIISP